MQANIVTHHALYKAAGPSSCAILLAQSMKPVYGSLSWRNLTNAVSADYRGHGRVGTYPMTSSSVPEYSAVSSASPSSSWRTELNSAEAWLRWIASLVVMTSSGHRIAVLTMTTMKYSPKRRGVKLSGRSAPGR